MRQGIWLFPGFTFILCGCFGAPSPRKVASPTPSSTANSTETATRVSTAPGARAVKIIFKNPVGGSEDGSFGQAPIGGTPATPGSGLRAIRVFNADGTLLAKDPSSPTWPKWLKAFEIGVSGPDNESAKNTNCARFADFSDGDAVCVFNPEAAASLRKTFNCGAPPAFYRVSEYDCFRGADTLPGTGGSRDGVTIRAYFSREAAALAPHENILAVLEYTASSLNPAPAQPLDCWRNGSFSPSNPGCSDLVWQAFLKRTPNDDTRLQPFLLLVPPIPSFVNPVLFTTGTTVSTKQFILPLASDPELSVLQISRITGLKETLNETRFKDTCNGAAGRANSALCVGILFHSITFFRI